MQQKSIIKLVVAGILVIFAFSFSSKIFEDVDAGEIIIQKAIRIDYTETPWQLGARIFTEENKLLVEAVKLLLHPHPKAIQL